MTGGTQLLATQKLKNYGQQIRTKTLIKKVTILDVLWPEANQLADYKQRRGFDLRIFKKQIEVVVRAGVELEGLLIVSGHLATKPSCHQQIRHQE